MTSRSSKNQTSSGLRSAIYEGTVRHRRNGPKKHQFDFRFFMLLLDLDELDDVFEKNPFWSTSRRALCRLNRSDHLKKHLPQRDLRTRVITELKEHGISSPIGSIQLLTQLSYLGFRMNPVSFYYCYDRAHKKIEAIIAEVNNTPWGEQHTYVIKGSLVDDSTTVRSEQIKKDFHVSPFFDLAMNYRMAFSVPGNKLAVKIENHMLDAASPTPKILDVTLALERRKLSHWNLNGLLVRYPLISFRVFAGIYFQALVLYLKKIPFVPHPNKKSDAKLLN